MPYDWTVPWPQSPLYLVSFSSLPFSAILVHFSTHFPSIISHYSLPRFKSQTPSMLSILLIVSVSLVSLTFIWTISLSSAVFCTFIKGLIFFTVSVTSNFFSTSNLCRDKILQTIYLPQFFTLGLIKKSLGGLLTYTCICSSNSIWIFLSSIKSTCHTNWSLGSKIYQSRK